MNWYAHNRPLLLQRRDLSAEMLEDLRPPPEWSVEPSSAGEPTASLASKLLHSRRDPLREAAKVTAAFAGSNTLVVFYGFGLGYAVERLILECLDCVAAVIEPEAALLRAALEARDLNELLRSERVHFLVGEAPDTLAMLLRTYESRSTETIRLRPLVERHQSYFDSVDAVQQQFSARRTINANTLRRFGAVWVRNLARNLSLLRNAAGVSLLHHRFRAIPALVLAAGPSLDLVLPRIQKLRQRTVLVAVDTAAAALAATGIEPDILVVVDPQWWNTRHLDRLTFKRTIVVSESSTHPRVFRLLGGIVLFAASLFPLGRFLEQSTRVAGTLGAGGSVATSAWDLARLLGCSPVYCAGLDLGFPAKRTHYHGSYFEERVHTLSTRLFPADHHAFSYLQQAAPYPVADNCGGEVLTDRRMEIYLWWFANQAKIHRDCDTRTLSPCGARIDGVPFARQEQLLSLPERRTEIESAIDAVHAEVRSLVAAGAPSPGGPADLIDSRLAALIDELQQISDLCRRGLDAVARLRDRRAVTRTSVAEASSELDRIDAELQSLANRDIAGFMVQDTLTDITRSAGLGAARGSEAADPLAGTAAVYDALGSSARFHLTELKRALRFLEDEPRM